MSNLDLCPCAIMKQHDPKFEIILCNCMGVDPDYKKCNGDYNAYIELKNESESYNAANILLK